MSAARSGSAVLLVAAVGLAGCTTTQDRNARFELRAKRILAAREPVRVTVPNPGVAVERVDAVRGRRGAIVVVLRNTTGTLLTDLPIAVGVGATPLNVRRGLDYAQTRVLAIAPGATVRWVFATRKPLPKGAPFARVGSQDAPRAPTVASLPKLSLSGPAGKVRLVNDSGIPQYNVPVYALSRAGDRYVAAGRAVVDELDRHATVTVSVPLAGRPQGAVELEALPTTLR